MEKPSSICFLCRLAFFWPDDQTKEGIEYRIQTINDLRTQILFMVYYGHFTYTDCISMTPGDLKWYYEGLLEIQRKESESLKGLKN